MEEILNKILAKVTNLETDVSGLKEDVSGLKEDVSGLKGEVSGLKGEVSAIREEHGNKLNSLESKLNFFEVEMKTGFAGVNNKLDTIYAQVAHNTEQEVLLKDIAVMVESHDTDIKLIKKVISNQ